ncbi:MAG: nitrogen fixation protein NifQ [Xanthobacteraceae bacterium]
MTLQFGPPMATCADPKSAVAACHRGCGAEDIYLALTGWYPDEATLDDDQEFDAHVFASIIAIAAAQGSAVHAHIGLSVGDFRSLVERMFHGASDMFCACEVERSYLEDDEVAMVRGLLMAHRSFDTDKCRWLAAMIARRAVEPNHLWEDLGLRNRAELSRLLMRHFGSLAGKNTRNMRWKRFFYRMLCEADGMVQCATPVCADCSDFDLCFGEETGESRLARARRDGPTGHNG